MPRNAVLLAITKVAIVCLAIIGVMGLIFVFFVLPKLIRTEDVSIPNLIGQSYRQATQLVYEAGLQFHPEIEIKSDPNVPKGYIMEQSPPANFRVKLGKHVRIIVSTGGETQPVPTVTGKPLEEAEVILKKAGFRRDQQVAEVHSDRFPEVNTVISQTPPAGAIHDRGGSVRLLLSLGVHPKVLRMPDLRNKPIDEVRALLKSQGLEIGKEEYQQHPQIANGLVIDHTPAANDLIQVGQSVVLQVSGSRRSRTAEGFSVPITYQVSELGAPFKHVRIVVEDQRGAIPVVNQQYSSGTLIKLPPRRVFGETTMVVYEDGRPIKREKLQ